MKTDNKKDKKTGWQTDPQTDKKATGQNKEKRDR